MIKLSYGVSMYQTVSEGQCDLFGHLSLTLAALRLACNLLLLFNRLLSAVWRWEGHMSHLLTISECDSIGEKMNLCTFSSDRGLTSGHDA